MIALALLPSGASARVVVSEVMWMGSDLSTADEWVELALAPGSSGSLISSGIGGWRLSAVDSAGQEKTLFTFPEGASVDSGQYLLLSNYAAAQSRLLHEPDFTTTALSLPNTKLLLRLYDASGSLVDTVDDGVGVPFAGENASGTGARRSMERIVLSASGSAKESWRSAETFLGWDEGALLFGTPGFPNGSGPHADLFAPSEATDLVAFTWSGTLTVRWVRSTALDLAVQRWSAEPDIFSGGLLLPASSTGFTIPVLLSGAMVLRLMSIDRAGNASSGVAIAVLPFVPDPPEEEPPGNSGTFVHPGVYITEVLGNPAGKDDDEWIELGNLGTGAVSIAGWVLNEGNSPGSFVIPRERTLSGAWPPKIASGFLLEPGEHVSFRKSVSGLPLGNEGETVSLSSGASIIDSWPYPEAAEQVSYGRSPDALMQLLHFCLPTEGAANSSEAPEISIGMQSGGTQGVKKLSLNLIAEIQTGSLASAHCSWDFGDAFTSESCNPPSHTLALPGLYAVRLSVRTVCGQEVFRELPVEVLAAEAGSKKVKKADDAPAAPGAVACRADAGADIIISEFLPDPYGEEAEGEWVELLNAGAEAASLCGWLLDDGQEGGKRYALDSESIAVGEYLVLPRSQTKIALNNEGDSVRLFAGSGALRAEVSFAGGEEGESMGLRGDGLYVWTPYPTPGEENRFRGAERRFPGDRVIVSAALPNPVGEDAAGEWIELANVSEAPVALQGWSLDNKEGGSEAYSLEGLFLAPAEIRRFSTQQTGIKLTNTEDVARLLDPDGYVASVLGWVEAVEGRIYRPPVLPGERVPARVVNVVDGDTIDIALTDIDRLDRVPDALRRRWLGIQSKESPSIRVRLLGIDTPETVHPSKPVEAFGLQASGFTKSLLMGKGVELQFDSELFDKYERLLAYVFLEDGTLAQAALLRHGLAYAYLRFPFARRDEFLAYEREAKEAKLGIWSDPAASQAATLLQAGVEEEVLLEELGLTLAVAPPSGLVASGTVVSFTPSFHAALFLSVDSGAFLPFSGSVVITRGVLLRAYAERGSGTGALRSETLEAAYVLVQERYAVEVEISEVYPSPVGTGAAIETQEWIELRNLTAHPVALAGWMLDDAEGAGSKPVLLPGSAVVPASGSLILTKEETGLVLNNDGDDVRLTSPDGTLLIEVTYPRVKKGAAYAMLGGFHWCLTDSPTPYEQNMCTSIVSLRKEKKPAKSAASSGLKSQKKPAVSAPPRRGGGYLWYRYRNVLHGAEQVEAGDYPETWQLLSHLQQAPGPQANPSHEVEVLLFVLALLPALRLISS